MANGPEWKQIPGFSNYWLSDRGHIFNMERQQLKKSYITNKGIRAVRLSRNDRIYTRGLKKLQQELFGEN